MVKKLFILFIVFGFSQFSFGQTFFGAHFNPGLAGALVKATNAYGTNNVNEHNDSIQNIQEHLFAPAFGLHVSQRLKRFDELYIGLRYQVYGWQRKRTDLLFPDSLHTDIGKIQAIQPAGDMEYYYRFHNISIPIYYFKTIKWDKMPKGMNIGFYGGGSLNVVVSKKAKAKSIGFTAYNKREFDLPSEKFEMLPVTISIEGGVRMRQALGDDYYFSFTPGLSFIPIPSSNSYERQFQYKIQVGLGVSKAF
jgi:hypothetical protein